MGRASLVLLAGLAVACGEAAAPSVAENAGGVSAGAANVPLAGNAPIGGATAGSTDGNAGGVPVAGATSSGGVAGSSSAGAGGAPTQPVIPGGPDESMPADAGPQPFVHPLFTDHMILQRDAHTPVWGWSAPGDKVTVAIAGKTFMATADQYGRWLVRIGPFAADGLAYKLEISGPKSVSFSDVKFGDVWLCGGQSNMEFALSKVIDAAAEIAASANPDVRFFYLKRTNLKAPRQTFAAGAGPWTVVGPATIGSFSGVCYFMTQALQKKLNVPMGMIGSWAGGTSVEWWTSAEKLGQVQDFAKQVADFPNQAFDPNQSVITSLYNAMIAPLLPYGLKGIAWYQGENNAGRGRQYNRLMPTLVEDWRTRFRMGNLPFLQVQLPNFKNNGSAPGVAIDVGSSWALLREAQLQTRLADPAGGLAVTADVGLPLNLHPNDKRDVGVRLAAAALHVAYGQDVVFEGPLFKLLAVQGSKAQLTFDSVGGGLMAGTKDGTNTKPVVENPGGTLTGFAISGADKQWKPATAVIDAGGKTVTVSAAEVAAPVAVRYGWADSPACNLYNREGLLASPFRTDADYGVSIIDGSGSGILSPGQPQTIAANAAPAGQHFVEWVGDVKYLDDANKASALLTMPQAYVSIRATYAP